MPLPEDWPLRRIRALRRDGYQCQSRHGGSKCLAPANRVSQVEPGPDHSLDNLLTLCVYHT